MEYAARPLSLAMIAYGLTAFYLLVTTGPSSTTEKQTVADMIRWRRIRIVIINFLLWFLFTICSFVIITIDGKPGYISNLLGWVSLGLYIIWEPRFSSLRRERAKYEKINAAEYGKFYRLKLRYVKGWFNSWAIYGLICLFIFFGNELFAVVQKVLVSVKIGL